MSIYYNVARYYSFARTGKNYIDIIKRRYPVTENLADSKVVVLHHEPHNYAAIYGKNPLLSRRYVISVSVWEASELPEAYKRSLAYVQEVWTCSQYCYNVFRNYHPNVVYIPYVVDRDITCSEADRDFVRSAIKHQPHCVYYLNITKAWDKRKNLGGLLRTFHNHARAMPNARLIVKLQQSDPGPWHSDDKVTVLSGPFTNGQINALYELADVYVSPHHGEGWGLTLSDAILFGKPTLATGYSGNLEFMTRENSLLLNYSEEYIRLEDCFGHFHSGMKWAYPNEDDLGRRMVELYESHQSPAIINMVRKAREDVRLFSSDRVEHLIHGRLDQIVSS
jgi:hypothetical protein